MPTENQFQITIDFPDAQSPLASLFFNHRLLFLNHGESPRCKADREASNGLGESGMNRRIPGSNARLAPRKSAVHEQALSDIARLESLRSHFAAGPCSAPGES